MDFVREFKCAITGDKIVIVRCVDGTETAISQEMYEENKAIIGMAEEVEQSGVQSFLR